MSKKKKGEISKPKTISDLVEMTDKIKELEHMFEALKGQQRELRAMTKILQQQSRAKRMSLYAAWTLLVASLCVISVYFTLSSVFQPIVGSLLIVASLITFALFMLSI